MVIATVDYWSDRSRVINGREKNGNCVRDRFFIRYGLEIASQRFAAALLSERSCVSITSKPALARRTVETISIRERMRFN